MGDFRSLVGVAHSKLLSTGNDGLRFLPIILEHLAQLHNLLVQEVDIHLLTSNHWHPVHASTVAIAIDLLLLLLLGYGRRRQSRDGVIGIGRSIQERRKPNIVTCHGQCRFRYCVETNVVCMQSILEVVRISVLLFSGSTILSTALSW